MHYNTFTATAFLREWCFVYISLELMQYLLLELPVGNLKIVEINFVNNSEDKEEN